MYKKAVTQEITNRTQNPMSLDIKLFVVMLADVQLVTSIPT
jgi:hypothetical protein